MMTRFVLSCFCFYLAGCASSGSYRAERAEDPYESWNRGVYSFNEGVDAAILAPVSKGYRAITNKPIRSGVSNFLNNLGQPVVFLNSALQGKPNAAVDTFGRFIVNSTIGVAGIFDPATAFGIEEHDEDFGQTLGHWGVESGPFLMLPFVGPSNVRDLVGSGVDAALDPLNQSEFDGDMEFRVSRGAMGAVSTRERLDESLEILREQPEPYIALRRNYEQSREAAIRDGQEAEDPFADLPDFDDGDFFDDSDW